MRIAYVACALVVALLPATLSDRRSGADVGVGVNADPAEEVLREQRAVVVDRAMERWRLVWEGKPQPACAPDDGRDDTWTTCPCSGFAFGERGDLDLVRLAGTSPDRLPLTPLFDPDWVPFGGT